MNTPQILTCSNAATVATIRVFADIAKAQENGETVSRVLDVVVPSDADARTVIESMVSQSMGTEWHVLSVWKPEPLDEF